MNGRAQAFDSRWNGTPAAGTIVAAALVVHAAVLKYPLIQDDWIRLGWVMTSDLLGTIVEEFSPIGKSEYRPLGALYFLLVARVFQLNAVVTHAVALIIHCVNALLVALVLGRITRDRLIAWAAGVLYASAALVHLDTLLWASGIFDLGSAGLALLSIWLFTRGRHGWAAAAYAAALLFKESVGFLPAVLAVWTWTTQDRSLARRARTRDLLRQLWPFGVVFVVHAGFKLAGESPLAYADNHPYAVRVTGPHVVNNLLTYSRWAISAIVPVVAVSAATAIAALAVLAVVLAACLLALHSQRTVGHWAGATAALVVWLGGAFAPFPFLPNHVYKYYLTMSLPALFGLLGIAVRLSCARAGLSDRLAGAAVGGLVVASVIASAAYVRDVDRRGLNQAFIEGTNDLVRRGATVKLVHEGLTRLHPSLPPRSVLLFSGLDIWAFGKDAGPQIWYGDPTIRADDARFLARDASGWLLRNPVESPVETYTGAADRRVLLNCCPVYLFELTDAGLVERPLPAGGTGADAGR